MALSLGSVRRERPMRTIWVTQMTMILTCCAHCAAITMTSEQQRRQMQHVVWLVAMRGIPGDGRQSHIPVSCKMCKRMLYSSPVG